MVTNPQIVLILSSVVLFAFAVTSTAATYEIRWRRDAAMVTHRTVAAVMRSMAVRQSQYLRKESPVFASISKAAIAFLALFVTNLLAALTTTGTVWPSTLNGWLTFVGTVVVGTFGVWFKSNFTTSKTVAAKQSVRLKGQKPVVAK